MGKLLDVLKKKSVLVSDGAWGTLLQEAGLEVGSCPEKWNIDHPDKVLAIAKAYIEAGSDMIETNSFGGNRYKLDYYGLADNAFEINRAAAALSRRAAGDKLVAGSMGPTGKFLMMGELTEEEMFQAYQEQALALKEGGADALIVETMTDLQEAVVAVKAAKATGLDVICTMTFDALADRSGYRSMMGVSPSEMIDPLLEAGADILGSNCGNGSTGMIDIVREIRSVNASVPILIHANAGLPIYENAQTIFPETPECMAGSIPALLAAGADIVGGCCGTTPNHIKAIIDKVRFHENNVI